MNTAIKIYPYIAKYMDTYEMPEGLKDALRGKSLEEQLAYYRCTYNLRLAEKTGYDLPVHEEYADLIKPQDLPIFLGAVVDEGLVVGVKLKCTGSEESCLVGKSVCTYFASDNNGAGYKTYEKYLYLVSVRM